MEIETIIKTILVCIQWLALGVQIGFGEAQDNYTTLKKMTNDEFINNYLDNRIAEADQVKRICFIAIIVILIIVIAI